MIPRHPRSRPLMTTLAMALALATACGGTDDSPGKTTSGDLGASAGGMGGATSVVSISSVSGATTGPATSGTMSSSTSSGGSTTSAATSQSAGGTASSTGGETPSDSTTGVSSSSGGSAGAGTDSTSSAGGSSTGDTSTGGAGGSGGSNGFNPCPTEAGSECKVLPLGDSITEGCCSQPFGGYRIELFRQARADNKGLTFVGALQNGPAMVDGVSFPRDHEGHGGYTIDSDAGHSGISGMITQNALQNYQPHIVLLMIGTNDINGNVDINNAPNRLANLVDDITTRAPDALLVVAAIIPTTNDGTNAKVEPYNAAMEALVEERASAGKHVVFLDNYAAFRSNPNYKTALMADGLHPNTAGYEVLGQAFYGVIGELLPPAQ